jgi:peptide deformylase
VPDDYKNTSGLVVRSWKIVVKGYSNYEQKEKTFTLTGYPAIVFQHELDHLQGKLFFDWINNKNPWQKDDNLILI